MPDRSRAKRGFAVAFLVVFVVTAFVFVSVEAAYIGVLDRDSVSATVTEYAMVEDADGPAVRVTVRVDNPTTATVDLRNVQTVAGYAGESNYPVARVEPRTFGSISVQAGGSETVTLRLRPTDAATSVREAVAEDRLVVSGAVSASIGSEQFDVPIAGEEGSS